MRIGQGFDVHAFEEDGTLVLGGVTVPHTHGLKAHSDGDVLLHALCDALLGAAGLGDIGRHFPDSSAEFKDIDSRKLLRSVISKLQEQGFSLGNADLTIVAQAPKLAPFVEKMCRNISEDVGVNATNINVKATTTEHLGFTGRKEGIAAFAIVLLREPSVGAVS